MSEYASEWPESKVKEFLTLDKNGDGVVTPAECVASVESGFSPGASSFGGSAPSSRGGPSATTTAAATPTGTSATPAAPTTGYTESQGATPAAAPAGIDPRYVSYAQSLVSKYDANKDGVLDKAESAQVSVVKPETDADGNGQITAEELAKSLMKK